MLKTIEIEKQKIKEAINENIDKYFESIENLKTSESLDINQIERLWSQERESMEGLLRKGTETAVNEREIDSKKKRVPSVLEKSSLYYPNQGIKR